MKLFHGESDLAGRLKWLMFIRLVLITIILAFGALVFFFEPGPFYVIGAFYVATIIYTLLLKSSLDLRLQGYIQLSVELALITFVVHITGGVESIFVGFYVITILCASVLLPVGGGIVIAILASVFFSGLVLAEVTGLLPFSQTSFINPYVDAAYVAFLLFYRIAILLLAGFLSNDIAGRLREAGREIDKLRDLNELILRHITSGLLTTNSNGQIIHANRSAEIILETARGGLLGRSWVSLFGLEDQAPEESKSLIGKAKSSLRAELAVPLVDGRKKPVGLSLSDIRDEDGAVIGHVIVFRDLTEIKELEDRVRMSDRLSAVGELAAGIAHEIRNPLASIRGSIEVLKERGMFGMQDEKLVSVILKESDRLNQIIQSFLDYVRARPSSFDSVNLEELVDEIIMLLKHSDKVGDRIRLERRTGTGHLTILGDADQLKQVFFNLLDNAVEAMQDGGVLTVECRGNGGIVQVEIADTGEGIAADKGRLFEPFYTTKPKGVGIGLTIADRIVRNHGGRIEARNREGGGSVFTVVLPREGAHGGGRGMSAPPVSACFTGEAARVGGREGKVEGPEFSGMRGE